MSTAYLIKLHGVFWDSIILLIPNNMKILAVIFLSAFIIINLNSPVYPMSQVPPEAGYEFDEVSKWREEGKLFLALDGYERIIIKYPNTIYAAQSSAQRIIIFEALLNANYNKVLKKRMAVWESKRRRKEKETERLQKEILSLNEQATSFFWKFDKEVRRFEDNYKGDIDEINVNSVYIKGEKVKDYSMVNLQIKYRKIIPAKFYWNIASAYMIAVKSPLLKKEEESIALHKARKFSEEILNITDEALSKKAAKELIKEIERELQEQ